MCEDTGDEPKRRSRGRGRVTAVHKSLDLLTRRDHGTQELRQKLRVRDYDPLEIEEALTRMVDWGYLNEPRFIDSYIRQRAQRGEGPRRIIQALCFKGVPKDMVLASALWKDLDWVAQGREVHARRLEGIVTPMEKQRRRDFFLQKGFTMSQITQILSERVDDES